MPKTTEKRQIAINSATNTGHMAVKVVVMFFVTPILVHGLGDVRYGVWMFVNSVIAYLALGNFGVNKAVVRYVAKFDGLNDHQRISRVFTTSSAILACVGACILAVTISMAFVWRRPFGVTDELAGEAWTLLFLLACTLAVSLTLGVSRSVLAGLGRFPALNGIRTMSLLLRNALLVGAVWCGGGLAAVGGVVFAVCVLDVGCAILVARRYFPKLTFSPRYVDWETVRVIGGYGSNMFIGSIAFLVISQSAFLVIGAFLSAESITYYSIGSSLKDQVLTVFVAMIAVLVPAVSKWEAVGDSEAIRRLFIVATRYGLFMLVPVELGLLILGRPFLALWMGPQYADTSYMTLVVVSVPMFLSASHLVGARILEGIGKVRPLALILVAQAVVTVGLCIVLVRPYGIEGVALAISLPLAICSCAVTVLVCRYLEVNLVVLLRRSFIIPLSASAVAGLVWILATQWYPVNSWGAFFGIGILGMVPYLIIVATVEPRFRYVVIGAAGRFAALLSPAWRATTKWLGVSCW